MPLDLSNLTDEELILAYGHVLGALRERGIIRTKNIVGELGERYCETIFNKQVGLPSFAVLPTNAKDVDAEDCDWLAYSTKSVTLSSAKRTGLFHLSNDHNLQDKRFDYLLVCILNDSMLLRAIYRFEWGLFWELKSWSSTQKAWFLSLTKKNLKYADQVYNQ
ncbi:hypothetical protein [Arenicella xantha]|uniref:hypothetical protein n=1 Tax=Arenicella xantha TaxID=644221 RepID=UPI0011BDDD34|nr:hypothetical protein [Arenicella xantha]